MEFSGFDWDRGNRDKCVKHVRFELKRKDRAVSLRLPETLYDAVKARADKVGMPYQRFIRMAIEQALRSPSKDGRSAERPMPAKAKG
jgi:predicted DNA binding CopG/RHH family protein